jgi:hypothetical protein
VIEGIFAIDVDDLDCNKLVWLEAARFVETVKTPLSISSIE